MNQPKPDATANPSVLNALLAMQRLSWEQGVAAQAALDLGRRDLAWLMAEAAVTRQAADGRLGGDDDNAVNGAACGEAVLACGFTQAAQAQRDWLLGGAPRAADGTLFHLLRTREVWPDSVYMVLPFLALTGHTAEAERQVAGHRRRLCQDGLYCAAWNEDTGSLLRPEHWGGGNGWVAAGIARAIRLAPSLSTSGLPSHAREVIDAVVAHRRPSDGLFGNIVDDPASFPETNTPQMLAYASLRGAADGWLPTSYASLGRDLLAAADRHVDDRGVVRNACGSPTFDHPGTSPEAQAFNLMAHAAAT
jgi:unsaturated rhamnogalacturonyl hydrolase